MSESAVLELQIGGESSEAVDAAKAVSDALTQLKDSATDASVASGAVAEGMDNASQSASVAAEQSKASSDAGDEFAATLSTIGQTAGQVSPALAPVGQGLSNIAEKSMALRAENGELALSMGAIAGVVGAGVTAIVGLGLAAADDANEIMRLNAVMGIGEASTEKWMVAMEMAGGSADSLSRAVLTIGSQVTDAAAGNAEAASTFERLGISITNTDGSVKSAGQAFQDSIGKIAGMSDATARQEAVTALFGTRLGGQLLPLLEHYSEIMPRATDLTMSHAGAEGEAAARAIEYNIAMVEVKEQVEALGVYALPLLVSALKVARVGVDIMIEGTEVLNLTLLVAKDTAEAVAAPFNALGNLFGGNTLKVTSYDDAVQKLNQSHGLEREALAAAVAKMEQAGMGSDAAAAAADGYAASLDGTTAATNKLTDAQGAAVNALHLSKYGFAESAQGAASYAESLELLTSMYGDATQAAIALAQAQGQTVTYSGGSYTFSAKAQGGPVNAGQPYVVGEEGMEVFVPEQAGQIIPNSALRGGSATPVFGGGGGGGDFHFHYYQQGPTHVPDLRGQVEDIIKELALTGAFRGYLASA